ncbi:MAG: hypothetical protein Q9162_007579 [Coniocarpon cinnabarinum]
MAEANAQDVGLPNWRPRLPSRNWLIFITVVGSWTGALLWDRRQQKIQQAKWCTLVSHLGNDTLPTNKLQRRLTVYLESPPGDGLRSAREHFVDYVKPVLSAASMDYEVVEGRRQGDIRVQLAGKIRRKRRKAGEHGVTPEEEEQDLEAALERNRAKTGVEEWDGIGGDLVIGRHAWKEYVRGLHEGWLGPLDAPAKEQPSQNAVESELSFGQGREEQQPINSDDGTTRTSNSVASVDSVADIGSDDASPTAPKEEEKKEPEPPPKPLVPPPFNTPLSYATSPIARSTPVELTPSTPIAFPHLLGFLKTPIRMWRFINRRYDADAIGRQTAAAVLASHRSFHQNEPSVSTSSFHPESSSGTDAQVATDAQRHSWEQQDMLQHEESDWPKSVRKRPEDEGERELEWLDSMVLDDRLAARMRLFEVDQENEERADRIARGAKGIPGRVNEPRSDYED